MTNPPQSFGELNSPPPPPKKKKHQDKRNLLKKQKILFPTLNKKTFECLNIHNEYKVAKSKDQRRVRHLLSILFLLGR